MLTKKQSELLRFIHERLKETGVPPSFDEMKDALDLRSKSGIHRLIMALEERGFIRRLPNRARALEVLRLPESVDAAEPRAARGFSPSVIEGNLGRVRQHRRAGSDDAGLRSPSRSWAASPPARRSAPSRTAATRSPMPPELLASGEHFALEVRGDSMIEAGILEGDTVIIKQAGHAPIPATSSSR